MSSSPVQLGFVMLLSGCLAAPAAGSAEPEGETRILKVFLADFEDVPRPETYTREYFRDLFFGLGSPRETPEGRPIAGSVREYFLDLSEGRIEIDGEVADWVRIPRRITEIPHWKHGIKPFGESWPVIVAETLRQHGITGPDCTEKLRLPDGRMPELLVFLNTDWGIGGVNRGWGKLKEVLETMGLGDLWDENWLKLPSPYSSYSATIWRKAPGTGPDGTIDQVPPPEELELFPLSIMMHEMGHQLAGLPDLYTPAYEPWGVFDLMGGPAAQTHFPMDIAAFQRERRGWLRFTEAPRVARVPVELRPLASHKEAWRFAQGPGQESLVIENRPCLKYPRDYSEPPKSDGTRLIVYRYDPGRRALRVSRGNPVHRVTSVVRRPDYYGEVWGNAPFTEITADTKPWSRNSLGELWWEFREMAPRPDGTIAFDASCRARNLVADYHTAEWRDRDNRPVSPGSYGSPGGHVAIRHIGAGDDLAAVLHCRPADGGAITGRFRLTDRGPGRLYLTLAAPAKDGQGGLLTVSSGKRKLLADFPVQGPGDPVIALDVPSGSTDLAFAVSHAGLQPGADGVRIREARLVGLPPTLADLAASAEGATAARLYDGFVYGPGCLAITVPAGEEAAIVREFPLPQLPPGADLRALLGLSADTPAGARARVRFEYVAGAETLPCLNALELSMRGGAADIVPGRSPNAVTVLETGIPDSVCTAESACLRVTVERIGDGPATVVFPGLRVTGDSLGAPVASVQVPAPGVSVRLRP